MEKVLTKSVNKVYPKLFSRGRIGPLELDNRIVKAPQSTGLSNMDGTVSERLVRHYKKLARGGSGLIIVEYTYVDNIGSKSAHCQLGISDNEHIAGLSWLVSSIHDEGAKVGIQLEHCGRQKFLGTPPIKAPSQIPWPMIYEKTGNVPDELTIPEIKEIVECFGDAAVRAKMAGFDLVEIHAAHGYLITNFLSPHTNKRNDLYGGSLENRMRFLLEVIKNIKEKVGNDYPVTMRINGTDYQSDGITIEETIEVCKRAETLGIHALHVSGGDHHMMNYQVSPMTVKKGPNVWAADIIKKTVSIPVIASGSITTPQFAEDILEIADFVSLGRPLLADPFFPQKAKEGRAEDIIPCIRCNDGCLERTFFNFHSVRCSVNPSMGREDELPIIKAENPKHIAVIGGGPAGLEVARVSALRGHVVTLYEKDRLGGSLLPASSSRFKSDLHQLIDYYQAQVNKLGIKVIFEEVTPATLYSEDFDTVVVAVGGIQKPLTFKGMENVQILAASEVLLEKNQVGQSAIVVGGKMTGVEVALFMEKQGKQVTIIEQNSDIMKDELITFDMSYREWLEEKKDTINILTSTQIIESDDVGQLIVEKNGERIRLKADSIILANDLLRNHQLSEKLSNSMDIPVYHIGDGKQPGRIYDAIHAGYLLGLKV